MESYHLKSDTRINLRFDLRGTTSQGFRDEWHCHARAKPFVSRQLDRYLQVPNILQKQYITNVARPQTMRLTFPRIV